MQARLGGEAEAVKLARAIEAEFAARTGSGGLDILVNNIGGGDYAPMLEVTEAFYDQTMANNLRGAFFLTKALHGQLRDHGRVINLSSVGARLTDPGIIPAPETFLGVIATPEMTDDPRDGKGALVAWDPVAQKVRWLVQQRWMWNGGALSTAGGLVFQGDNEGWLSAYDAADGKRLWRFATGLRVIAPPISYSWRSSQYVSLLVGWAGPNPYGRGLMPTGWRYNAQPRRLLTFKLGSSAKLPPTAPYDETVHPLDDPALVLDCAAIGKFVREGGALTKGMPSFPHFSDEQLGQIYGYIRSVAREEKLRIATRSTSAAKR